MKDDAMMIAQLEDKIQQADDRYMITSGDFLDMHQRKLAEAYCRSRKLPVRVTFYGGYEDAERCIPVFLPPYAGEADAQELLQVLRVTAPKTGRLLTHRDYLGSVLALGIDRAVTGDILVRDASDPLGAGADIIVEASIAPFLQTHYDKAGRTSLQAVCLPIGELHVGAVHIEQQFDTVASLRLDSVAASAFRLSRAKAAEAIRRGLVSVNSAECLKPDREIHEKDKIVMRGRGKVILAEVGGSSRKDRIRVTFDIYR